VKSEEKVSSIGKLVVGLTSAKMKNRASAEKELSLVFSIGLFRVKLTV